MRIDKILQYVNLFYKLAVESEELPENSDNIETVLKNLTKLETHAAREKYAEKNLKHLSSGSSRIIYIMPNKKEVLKLAKNDRGIAQNKVESKIKCKYINRTTKSDPSGIWKISPFADKVSVKEFEKLCDMSFEEFGEALEYGLKDVADNSEKKPKNFEKISKTEMYKDIVACGKKNKLMPGDLSRISSWGKFDGQLVLLDAGLTKEIYDEFYE